MKEKMELVYGSGNIFRDFNDPNADVLQTKALLASDIIGTLAKRKLTPKKAEKLTGIDARVFERIQQPDLKRLTIDRLITILNKLDQQVEINIKVTNRPSKKTSIPASV